MAKIIRSHLVEGMWTGELQGVVDTPSLTVTLHGRQVDGVTVSPTDEGNWFVNVPVPAEALSDGSHSFLIELDAAEPVHAFSIVAGDAVADDLRAEISLLRAEMDMLKKAFRFHVVNT